MPFLSAETTAAPEWFTAAVNQRPDLLRVEVDGCRIHVRAWGDRADPPLVLVHGGGAHSGWWDHIAPFLATGHRVLAPDLSGHGDSGTRTTYGLRQWADEVLSAVWAVGSSQRPTIFGHSLGGWVAATAATHRGEDINSIAVIDSPLRDRAPEEAPLRRRNQRPTGYRSKEEIVNRFRPVPSQDVVLPYVRNHIAAESVRRTFKGWVWKFDPAIFAGNLLAQTVEELEIMRNMMSEMPCRVGYIRCANGAVPADMAQRIRDIMQLRGPFVQIAEAGHHPMLDQPLSLVATLRTLLEFWSIT